MPKGCGTITVQILTCQVCSNIYESKRPRPGTDGLFRCVDCSKKRNFEINILNDRNRTIFREYGLYPWQYDKMLKDQNNLCAICRLPEPSGRYLAVDHCHTTNKVRGLLCINCNNGLGRFKDNVLALEKAIKYLQTGGFSD